MNSIDGIPETITPKKRNIENVNNGLENIDIFLTVKKLFDLENPTHSPIFTEFKTSVKREL